MNVFCLTVFQNVQKEYFEALNNMKPFSKISYGISNIYQTNAILSQDLKLELKGFKFKRIGSTVLIHILFLVNFDRNNS
jgi:hypothetical protein